MHTVAQKILSKETLSNLYFFLSSLQVSPHASPRRVMGQGLVGWFGEVSPLLGPADMIQLSPERDTSHQHRGPNQD